MNFQFPPSPEVGEQVEGPNGFTYEWNGTGWITLGGGAGLPVQIAFVIPGQPADGQCYPVAIAVSFKLPANLDGSVGVALTAATASSAFGVFRGAAEIGTITFAETSAAFSGTETTFAAGDVLELRAPSPQDATLADVGITLLAERV